MTAVRFVLNFSTILARDVSMVQYGVSVYFDGTDNPEEIGEMLLGYLLGGVLATAV